MASEKLIVELTLTAGDTKTAFNKVENNAKKAGAKAGSNFGAAFANKIQGGLVSTAKRFAAIAVASIGFNAIASNVNAAVTSIRSFERALANVNSILPKNEKLTRQSIDTFKDFAGTFGTSSAIQADAFYTIVSAGIKGTTTQLKTLEVANQAAIAGLVNIDVASKALVSSVNSYAKSGLTAAKASDILFVAVREGQTTFGELAEFLGNAAPLAASAGLKFEELAGAIAGITKAGIKTDIAVTGVRALLTSLVKITPQAAAEAKQLGLDFSIAALRAKGFTGFLRDVQTATKGNVESLGRLFPNVRALTPILQVVNGNFEDFARIQVEVKNSLGATKDAADIVKESLDFKLTQATSNFALLRQEIINNFVPALSDAAASMTRFLTLNRDSASPVSKLKAQIGGLEAQVTRWAKVMKIQGVTALTEYDSNAELSQRKTFFLGQQIDKLKGQIESLGDANLISESPIEKLLQKQRELDSFNERIVKIKAGIFDLSETKTEFELLGDIATTTEEIKALEAALLAMRGVLSTVPAEAIKADKSLKKIEDTGKSLGKTVNAALTNGISKSIQLVITNIGKGEDAFKNFGKLVLNVIGDMAIKMGETLIFAGLGIESLKALGGAAAVAAGIGLVAIGTIIKNASGGSPSVGGAGGESSTAATIADDNEDLTDPESVESAEPQTSVQLIVQGDVLDSQETGTRLAQTLSDAFNKQGVALTDFRTA